MIRLLKIAVIFLKNSRMLTFSAFLSIFFACFLSVSMFQLSSNSEDAFRNSILQEYGDYQIGISKEGGEAFTEDEMAFIKGNDGVTNVSSGYYISDLDEIYAIGVVNDEVNESRYKYTYPVKEKEIVINKYLSEQYRKNIDDMITVHGQEFTVKEILTEDAFTVNKMAMLIMDISELHKLTGNPDTGMVNYVLLQCEEDKDITVITQSLENYSESFNVSCVEADEDLQRLLTIFKGILIP